MAEEINFDAERERQLRLLGEEFLSDAKHRHEDVIGCILMTVFKDAAVRTLIQLPEPMMEHVPDILRVVADTCEVGNSSAGELLA